MSTLILFPLDGEIAAVFEERVVSGNDRYAIGMTFADLALEEEITGDWFSDQAYLALQFAGLWKVGYQVREAMWRYRDVNRALIVLREDVKPIETLEALLHLEFEGHSRALLPGEAELMAKLDAAGQQLAAAKEAAHAAIQARPLSRVAHGV